MSEEEKQKLLEQFDKEQDEKVRIPGIKESLPGIRDHRYLISSGFRIRPLHAGNIKASFHPCRHDPDPCLHALSGHEKRAAK